MSVTGYAYFKSIKKMLETAKIYFSDITLQLQPKLKESDFGLVENKNHEELQDISGISGMAEIKMGLYLFKGESRESFKAMQRRI